MVKIHFGPGNDFAEDYYYIEKRDCTKKGLGIDGLEIKTQDEAQQTLVTLNNAIATKDGIRARLETECSSVTKGHVERKRLYAAEKNREIDQALSQRPHGARMASS